MSDPSTQSLVFLIDRLNVTKLVSPSPRARSASASPRLIESSDLERLLKRVCLRLFDHLVRLPVSRSGIRTLTYPDMVQCSRDRVLLEQKTIIIYHLCVILPGAHLHTFSVQSSNTQSTMQRPEPLPAPNRIPLSVHRPSSIRSNPTPVAPAPL